MSTTVLCTVGDPTAALGEVRRVLVPGGRFVFWEHVAAPARTLVRAAQEVWTCRAPDGCHANRDTLATIRAAGFAAGAVTPVRVRLCGRRRPSAAERHPGREQNCGRRLNAHVAS
ncbi:hypothetical protein OCAE111667_13125 [Occultella aeris]|uniref:Methyltransferase type 11 domain-containing protein n=1 Tax=Occultella aeris TaxID=2761496 RepID=A0A7M4DE23_9MICO|nr:hypothetical protein [Occultella aeris]VZO35137.1 hypothetical protein HALOF300_00363 [Occultella aeris]